MELGNIKPVSIVEQMTGAYLDYSMSVIVSRALPDVRDGLKPVHRRVLYAMDQMGLQSTKQFRKCAGTVGEVLKSYHPHGDVAVYDSLVRMAQPWSMRYPLVLGQGNFGSQDDDPPAAMRYTEAKMAAIADELLRDIDKDTIDFKPNYDNQTKEPTVLPARLPNLLLNGSTGIAVGMATNIPPHNLLEVCNGIIHLIDNPDATTEALSRIVRGPDFPTGGIIQGREGIRNTYASGRGRVVVRARTNFEETERGRVSIIVTELPYQINKADLVKKIAELARDRKIEGISEIRDESDRKGMRIMIELKRDANPDSVLNSLFKYTSMQSAFNTNMLALVDQQPRTLTLKAFLQYYINHREIVITRRTRFELAKAEARKHILDGLKIALDNLDAIIAMIRRSQSTEAELNIKLQQQFNFSEAQAKAILDMRLARLSALERGRIEEELKDVLKNIDYYKMLLADINEIRELIKEDLRELQEKYGDARRSDIVEAEAGEFRDEDLIPNEEVVVTLTEKGYIKRLPSSTYRAQRRGGRGITGMATREDDTVRHLLVSHTHDGLLFFTDRGRVFQLKAYEIPEADRTARLALNHAVEPADPQIGRLLELHSPIEVLAAIRADQLPDLEPDPARHDRLADQRVLPHRRRARVPALRGGGGEAARARHDVGDLATVDGAREALVQVGVPGQHGVGPEAGALAGGVDVVGEPGRAPVLRVDRRGRMVARHDHGSLARLTVRLQAIELRREELQLLVANRVATALGRDHPGALEHVAVEPDDRDERRVQREVHARLGHRAAHEPAGVGRRTGGLGAEVAEESCEGRNLRRVRVLPVHRAVVVARNREDRPVVRAEGLVELIVVVDALAEVVDDVPEMEEEGGCRRTSLRDVLRHRVRDGGLVREGLGGGLKRVHLGRPGVAHRVERDPLGAGDLSEKVSGKRIA